MACFKSAVIFACESAQSCGTPVAVTVLVPSVQCDFYVSASDLEPRVASVEASLLSLGAVVNDPFELSVAMSAFAFFFSTVVFFYAFARGCGAILDVIRPSRH